MYTKKIVRPAEDIQDLEFKKLKLVLKLSLVSSPGRTIFVVYIKFEKNSMRQVL